MTEDTKPAKKPPVDWELLEKEYRVGIKGDRQLGREYGVTHAAIAKRAKKFGWVRDLSAKVQQEAKSVVAKALVASSVSTETKLDDAATVKALGQKVADIDLNHRADLQLGSDINRGLLLDLKTLSRPDFAERLEAIGEFMDESGPNANGAWVKDKLNEEYRYIISIAGRIKMIKDLSASIGMFVPLQRKVVGLDADKQVTEVDDLLKKVYAERGAA